MQVKLVKVAKPVKVCTIGNSTTVEQLLSKNGIDFQPGKVFVNNVNATATMVLRAGDIVVVSEGMKGGV